MRKILLTLLTSIIVLSSFAQEEAANSYEPRESNKFLPKAGDIAIGLEATPFLNYIGNMFNGTSNNSLNLGDQTLYFRYYLTEDAAVRAAVRINSHTDVDEYYVTDDAASFLDPLSNKQVTDRNTYSEKNIEIKIGYQMFHNYKRLRGFYGGDLGYQYYKEKNVREYGNQMTQLNPSPTTNWGNLGTRTLENNYGVVHGLGLNAFFGGEFFFLPRVCIGGEVGVSYYYSFETQSYDTQERMVISQHVEEEIATSPGNTTRGLDTNFPYYFGNLYLMFHF